MSLRKVYYFLLMMVLAVACSKDKDPKKILAGESSKLWEPVKETDAQGNKVKLSKEEKAEKFQFNNNGTFSVISPNETNQGKWTYQEDTKNLSLHFGSANFSENFTVLDLKKDEITLKAEDGSTLVMEEADM